jgi:hypothetical protein
VPKENNIPSDQKKLRMKIALTTLLILVWGIQGQAQTKNKKQLYPIHKVVLKSANSNESAYGVYKLTKKSIIRDFDFKNPDGLDTSASNIWKKPKWKAFLNRIDTTTIAEYSLSTKNKGWFKSAGKAKRALAFAPIMISDDGTMALSIIMLHNQLGHASTSRVYFLEKKDGTWNIKQDRIIALID